MNFTASKPTCRSRNTSQFARHGKRWPALWSIIGALLVGVGPLAAATPQVAGGAGHSIALAEDGRVSAWGDDSVGQLGVGRAVYATTPQPVPGLNLGANSNNARISTSGRHVMAVKSDGTVWAWGANDYGQLCDYSTTARNKPVLATGFSGITAVATGEMHSATLKSDGTVWSCGSNASGQLGVVGNTTPGYPVQVASLSAITAIASGQSHALALQADGSVWTWGANSQGQLGDGTTTGHALPVKVAGLQNVIAIAGGWDFSLALKGDGTVWAWGGNYYGQIGDRTNSRRLSPVQVIDLVGVKSIAAGFASSIAITQQGAILAWGYNGAPSFLGDGFSLTSSRPVTVIAVSNAVAVAAGMQWVLATQQDGTLWSWGQNYSGQLGNGTLNPQQPSQIPNIDGVVAVSAGVAGYASVAVRQDGSVWTWGSNQWGQLGIGSKVTQATPVALAGLTNVEAVSAGAYHSLALKSDRTVWAWGDNFNGQLGDGTMTKHAEPIRVPGISDIVALDAGAMHSLALRSDGTVLTWGLNLDFQLGDSTRNIRTVPSQVPGLAGVAAVAGGDKHSIALKKDGSVWAWGANDQGQLGDGTTVGRFTPMQVPNISNVVAIAAGGLHNLAMTQDGSVWSWGANWSGQLGDGSTVSRAQPQRVGTLRDIRVVAAGSGHSLAIDRSGLAWAWGLDSGLVPALIQDSNSAVSVGAGAAHTLIVFSDGTVRSWGRNQFGQLGDGTLAQRRTPAMVLNDALTGSLDLSPSVPNSATGGTVPFFATVSSDSAIGSSTATVLTTIKFNEGDKGKSGSVYVTARVPAGALATGLADVPRAVSPLMAKVHESSAASSSLLASTGKPFELIQLTASGWKPVVNGQLVPYASGVLGDQLAAQTILNGTSIANLAGSEFCLGYGVNAAQMTSAEFVRSVATIPDGSNASNGNSCLPIALPSGWNLLGNSVSQSLPVSALFADASWVNSLWSWDPANSKWQFWSPGMSATELQNEIVNKGYSLLTSIGPGQGYWVHTSAPGAVLPPSGSAYNLNTALQPSGWSLLAAGVPTTPRELSNAIGNVMSIWAWDAALQKWLFYAPSLEAQGATVLKNYAETEGYRDFASSSKTLGPNVGFWLKK